MFGFTPNAPTAWPGARGAPEVSKRFGSPPDAPDDSPPDGGYRSTLLGLPDSAIEPCERSDIQPAPRGLESPPPPLSGPPECVEDVLQPSQHSTPARDAATVDTSQVPIGDVSRHNECCRNRDELNFHRLEPPGPKLAEELSEALPGLMRTLPFALDELNGS